MTIKEHLNAIPDEELERIIIRELCPATIGLEPWCKNDDCDGCWEHALRLMKENKGDIPIYPFHSYMK